MPSMVLEKLGCSYASRCGGCPLHELTYDKQLEQKTQAATKTLQIHLPSTIKPHIIASPQRDAYRNRVLLRGRINAGKVCVGYFGAQSREFVAVSSCAVANNEINRFIGKLERLDIQANGQAFRLEVQLLPNNAKLFVTISPGSTNHEGLDELSAKIANLSEVAWAGLHSRLEGAPHFTYESSEGVTHLSSPGVFQQINLQLNHYLRGLIKSYSDASQAKYILDLFCGAGNLSLGLAGASKNILGTDQNLRSIAIANEAARENHLRNVRYFSSPLKGISQELSRLNFQPELVIADPPRRGLMEALPMMNKLSAKHLVYVSCDYETLSKDLAELRSYGFEAHELSFLDFFPYTTHIETVVFLVRRR